MYGSVTTIEMSFFTKNINLLKVIMAVLFFVGTSGFTAILEHCCCSEESAKHMEADKCLEPSAMMEHTETDHASSMEECLPPTSPTIAATGNACHTKIVAGGLSSLLSLLEKEIKLQDSKLQIGNLSLSVSDLVIPVTTTAKSYSSLNLSSSPPSVEKYVLNASFLI